MGWFGFLGRLPRRSEGVLLALGDGTIADVPAAHWSEFDRFEQLRAAGRTAARQAVHTIRALSSRRRPNDVVPEEGS